MTRKEWVASLRRHHSSGRWQARIWKRRGKEVYLGTFDTQEEAAQAYDVAVIKIQGLDVVTNLDMRFYHIASIVAGERPHDITSKNALSLETTNMILDEDCWPDDEDLSFPMPSSNHRYDTFFQQALIRDPGDEQSWLVPP